MKNIEDYIEPEDSNNNSIKNGSELDITRDSKGRILPGSKLNPNGRPPAGEGIIDLNTQEETGFVILPEQKKTKRDE